MLRRFISRGLFQFSCSFNPTENPGQFIWPGFSYVCGTSAWMKRSVRPQEDYFTSLLVGLPGRGDIFCLGELQQAVVGAFASETALLGATEWSRRIRHKAAIQRNHAGI